MKVSIVIPIYKEPTADEIISLCRCCEVLYSYPMTIVAPERLSLTTYLALWSSYGLTFDVEYFNCKYFKSIAGYNRLMLSQEFYLRFTDYEYILIYQPDAYVFRNDLEKWCEKGYDYIGAPLVGTHLDQEYYPSLPMRVGNGGLSLRRVQAHLNYFEGKKNVFNSKQIIERISLWEKPHTRVFVWMMMMIGWKNKPLSLARNWRYNEDDFWSGVLDNSHYALKKPLPNEALEFAFERFPKKMYETIQKLPFGCHAWRKYQYEEFWHQYIDN